MTSEPSGHCIYASQSYPLCADLYEAISKFALENAIQLLQKWRVVKVLRVEGAKSSKRAVQLSPEYQNSDKIVELVAEISRYRKRSRVCCVWKWVEGLNGGQNDCAMLFLYGKGRCHTSVAVKERVSISLLVPLRLIRRHCTHLGCMAGVF